MPFHTLSIASKSRNLLTPPVLSPQVTARLLGSTEPNSPEDRGASPLSDLAESRGASPLSVPDVDEVPTGEERLAAIEAEAAIYNPIREKSLIEQVYEREAQQALEASRIPMDETSIVERLSNVRPGLPPLSTFAHKLAKPAPLKPATAPRTLTAVAAGPMPSLEKEGWFYKKFKGVIYRLVPKRHATTNAITGFTLYPKDSFSRPVGKAAAKDGAPAPPVEFFHDPEA